MATKVELTPVRTYASEANAVKAVENKIDPNSLVELRYFIMPYIDPIVGLADPVRYFPVFIGLKALDHGVHFHFNIIA